MLVTHILGAYVPNNTTKLLAIGPVHSLQEANKSACHGDGIPHGRRGKGSSLYSPLGVEEWTCAGGVLQWLCCLDWPLCCLTLGRSSSRKTSSWLPWDALSKASCQQSCSTLSSRFVASTIWTPFGSRHLGSKHDLNTFLNLRLLFTPDKGYVRFL